MARGSSGRRLPAVLAAAGALALCAFSPPSASARSAFQLPPPPALGAIPAATFDDQGHRIGDASLSYEREPNGRIRLEARTAVDGGARNLIRAQFEEDDDGSLRVLYESSISHGADGNPMIFVEVDHEKRIARCTPPGATPAEAEELPLPDEDHVANTIMSLLFLPIVEGRLERVEFKAFLCRGGARFVDFVALRSKEETWGDRKVVEIRFGPDLGTVVSWFASVVVPKLRFWFDANLHGDYLAHRMPLYGGGPEVMVVRQGVRVSDLR